MHEIEFRSDRFLPELPETAQSNPGAYGFELAWWLARALQTRGIETGYPLGEDWGWFIEATRGDAEVMIGCGSVADPGEGYLGRPIGWRVFIRARGAGLGGLFGGRRREPSDFAVTIATAVRDVLAAEGITLEGSG